MVHMMTCSVPGCDTEASCSGLCRLHYGRWRRTGDPSLVLKRGRKPKRADGQPSYSSAHKRIVRTFGAASEQNCERHAASGVVVRARDWSYVGGIEGRLLEHGRPYSLDCDEYVALCRSCHSNLDRRIAAWRTAPK